MMCIYSDICALVIMISVLRGNNSRLFPVGVSALLILINRKTAVRLGVGFHSLNQ